MSIEILSHIGLEIEVESLPQDRGAIFSDGEQSSYWRTDHDASVESDGFVRPFPNGSRIYFRRKPSRFNSNVNNVVIGNEIVLNKPIDFENERGKFEAMLGKLMENICMWGEDENRRSGIHVHISMPTSWRLASLILKLGAHLEDLFFYIGGQGYTFRGQLVNESLYCRPITKWGPPLVPTTNQGRYAQILSLSDLERYSDSDTFWKRLGIYPGGDMRNRYHPLRYLWLNVYSLFYHGSIEFRVFNTTKSVPLIVAEIEFCRALMEYSMNLFTGKSKVDFPENSVYSERNTGEILRTFYGIVDRLNVSPQTVELLAGVVQRTPPVTLPKRYVHTHSTRNLRAFDFSNIGTTYFREDEAAHVRVDDIHARRGER